MAQSREPVVQTEPIGPSIPLQTSGKYSEAQMAGKSHITELRILRFEVPAAGSAQDTYELWTIPPGVEIIAVDAIILEAFDTSVTLQVQDGSANWIVAGELNEQVAGSVQRGVISAAGTGTNGVYYTTTDTIDLVIAGADATVGELGLKIWFNDWNKFTAADIA